MNQIKNRHAKMKDMGRLYNAATHESNLTAAAMVTILCRMLIDKGILVKGEVDAYLCDEKIRETREEIRAYIKNIPPAEVQEGENG